MSGVERVETQYSCSQEELDQMCLKVSNPGNEYDKRPLGGITGTHWRKDQGMEVSLSLSPEDVFIVAGAALGIPWERVRAALNSGNFNPGSVNASVTIPKCWWPSSAYRE